jgi:hypothetical protein
MRLFSVLLVSAIFTFCVVTAGEGQLAKNIASTLDAMPSGWALDILNALAIIVAVIGVFISLFVLIGWLIYDSGLGGIKEKFTRRALIEEQ